MAITGAIGGAAISGFFGSMSQLTWVTEASTFFVNLRWLLSTHKLTEGKFYIFNGLMMMIAFFFVRIMFYSYMIVFNIVPFCLDADGSNWVEYPTIGEKYFCYFLILAYLAMGSLQVFWFKKIVIGLLKAVGIIKKSVRKGEKKE
jgi:hypothetical protein